VRVLSDEEANGEYIVQDAHGPHTQHKDLRIHVEGLVHVVADEEANGEYIEQDAQGPHTQHKEPSMWKVLCMCCLMKKQIEYLLIRMPRVPSPSIRIQIPGGKVLCVTV
jgi:hypothetical protein